VIAVLIRAVDMFFQLIIFLIFARIILSWFVKNPYSNKFYMVLIQITEPILSPFRKLTGRFGASYGMDFSPILALIAINFANMLVVQLLKFFL
jgi:YggT family protein